MTEKPDISDIIDSSIRGQQAQMANISKQWQILGTDYIKEGTYQSQLRSEHLLEQIEENTASLNDITTLLTQSNLKQDQVISLMGEMFAITKAKDEAEAKTLYQKTIGRISKLGADVTNITTLVTLATGIYNAVKPLLN